MDLDKIYFSKNLFYQNKLRLIPLEIFERFYRARGKNEKTFPGLGLVCLFLWKLFTGTMQNIGVKSEPGKGSVFYFSIPLES